MPSGKRWEAPVCVSHPFHHHRHHRILSSDHEAIFQHFVQEEEATRAQPDINGGIRSISNDVGHPIRSDGHPISSLVDLSSSGM
jgi:hypothetical protein